MRICILSYRSYTYSGGQGVYLRYLSRAFRDMGHKVDIVSGPPYPELDEGVKLIKLPSLDLYTMSSVRRLFINPRKLDSRPDVVEWLGTMTGYFSEPLAFGMRAYNLLRYSQQKYDVIHDNQTMSYGVLKLRELGYPVVETIHHPVTIDRDLAMKSASLKNKLGYMRWYSFVDMQMKVARQLSHVITVSEMAKEHIADVFKIPPERLHVIYNGIDTAEFSPSDKVTRLENRLLAVISRDTAVKGLKYLLEALAILHQKHNLELVVVGSTMGDGVTEKRIHNLGLDHHVSFTDQIDTQELVNQYRQATITVVPSIYEGFGLPAAEAMACGSPVVCTTAGALPEVVGDAGVMVPPADVKALANAIESLMENPDRRNNLAHMGRQRIAEKFNWQTTAKQTLATYTEAIELQKP
ncbi:MAG: glycosyltransferase family 4 protein [Chloroflexi bacterium]|nr:glycosyltransferase family 4 protein [Chloroflexota bacterium]